MKNKEEIQHYIKTINEMLAKPDQLPLLRSYLNGSHDSLLWVIES